MFSLAREMVVPTRPAGMEDRFLLYAFEQCALEATKTRSFASMEEIQKCLEELRNFLYPVLPIEVKALIVGNEAKAVFARPIQDGDEKAPRRTLWMRE
jgi:hypothetical protein